MNMDISFDSHLLKWFGQLVCLFFFNSMKKIFENQVEMYSLFGSVYFSSLFFFLPLKLKTFFIFNSPTKYTQGKLVDQPLFFSFFFLFIHFFSKFSIQGEFHFEFSPTHMLFPKFKKFFLKGNHSSSLTKKLKLVRCMNQKCYL